MGRLLHEDATPGGHHVELITGALEYGTNWIGMLKKLADAECLVDVHLCAGAFGNPDDKERMVRETHGVRIIYVGEDYFIVGPKRPVHSSIIPFGWLSMIRIHNPEEVGESISLAGMDETSLAETETPEPLEQ
jgi:hypothetical protein